MIKRHKFGAVLKKSTDMYVSANFTQTIENAFKRILENYLNSWNSNNTKAAKKIQNTLSEENFNFVILYLMVMIGMFSFIIVAILVSTTRSKRQKETDELDPYSRYIANDFNDKTVGVTLGKPCCQVLLSSALSIGNG